MGEKRELYFIEIEREVYGSGTACRCAEEIKFQYIYDPERGGIAIERKDGQVYPRVCLRGETETLNKYIETFEKQTVNLPDTIKIEKISLDYDSFLAILVILGRIEKLKEKILNWQHIANSEFRELIREVFETRYRLTPEGEKIVKEFCLKNKAKN